MEVINQRIFTEWCPPIPLQRIEEAGRTSYASHDKACPGSEQKFVRGRVVAQHYSILEHVTLSLRMVTNIGVSREICRHRHASITEQSTRYCDFGKQGVRFIRPVWWDEWSKGEQRAWTWHMTESEKMYKKMREMGSAPERAREFLPLATATELVLTANLREWRHIFALRALGTTGRPHPQMRALMLDGLKLASTLVDVVFDDLVREAVMLGLVDAGEPEAVTDADVSAD
ncbi:MAG: FAD-dependent thymidylate synthase [Sphaerochaetaceae bacterium]